MNTLDPLTSEQEPRGATQRLSAIVFTDIAAYTAMMQDDKTGRAFAVTVIAPRSSDTQRRWAAAYCSTSGMAL